MGCLAAKSHVFSLTSHAELKIRYIIFQNSQKQNRFWSKKYKEFDRPIPGKNKIVFDKPKLYIYYIRSFPKTSLTKPPASTIISNSPVNLNLGD